MNHYTTYLRDMKQFDELFELLTMLNRPEEAAFVDYQRKLEQNKSGELRAEALKISHNFNFSSLRDSKFDASMIEEQIRLLDFQKIM